MGKIKMKDCEIIANQRIARDTWEIILTLPHGKGEESLFAWPGQFVNIKIDEKYLRRPISVCDFDQGKLTLIYKVVGSGTAWLAHRKSGEKLNLLYPLGNGFDTNAIDSQKKIVLIGGGVGVPPLYGLAKKLIAEGKQPEIIMGFATEAQVFYEKAFEDLGVPVTVVTLDGSGDGSKGIKGTVLDGALGKTWDYLFACGPEAMLLGIKDLAPDGQFSFESRMACGFGVCMGCSCKTKYGEKRICKDGPVLNKEEIIW